ncbi:single-stranded DNA-binding protein [Syntrophorhabdus aromaticivorans]|uniref:Single-stranded DNA-binding protein n=1 Tax=Syntrophorhabdus aromaticivorans TaxID=328301 RepID=A0A351U307_9BACT|nr:single-stranded DNA-binding protein [Syntrophorhabdus aromaticivorans]NLW34586.1 single-stranded DNA-binding protein [Syntrophorhabdus aromaticivorans]HBA54338.1 single-stranded DNA-binding protein [Syntrophorhabdus aromaticivorans]
MSNLNKAIIIGRLGADPELRHTADGIPVATFNVATTETRRDKNGTKQDKTEWHRIVAWRKLGEIAAEYLKKGRLVYIEGKIQSREFEGRDGVKRKTFEIVASEMKMLGGGGQGEREDRRTQGSSPVSADDDFIPEVEEDDAPL